MTRFKKCHILKPEDSSPIIIIISGSIIIIIIGLVHGMADPFHWGCTCSGNKPVSVIHKQFAGTSSSQQTNKPHLDAPILLAESRTEIPDFVYMITRPRPVASHMSGIQGIRKMITRPRPVTSHMSVYRAS